ncbi:hypothetical protein LCGC14_2091120, partial [marine sediment metagenome]
MRSTNQIILDVQECETCTVE